ncbi:MAG: beta-galactosidase [Thermoanaerobacteraceae bacterium]
MSIYMENKYFIINNKPVFLYGGEFHYFRSKKSEWSDRLDKIKEAGCNLVSTYIPWMWHEKEENEIDLNGITCDEKDLEGFLQLVNEKGLYCIVRPGPYIMSETKNSGIPKWIFEKYPDVIAKNKNGDMHPAQVITYQNPIFLDKVSNWYKAVNKVISKYQIDSKGSIIMYQLCNEAGMFHWVTNTWDYSENVQIKFNKYLTENNRSLEYIAKNPYELHYEMGRFWREYIKEYMLILKSYAKRDGIKIPFIINIHGFKDISLSSRGMDYPIGLSQLYNTKDIEETILAGDFYPGHITFDSYHDLILSCTLTDSISNKNQPIFSAEFQSGRLSDRPKISNNDVDLTIRTCIANGMNAINFYMFVSGENYQGIGLFGKRHDWQAPVDITGKLRPHYYKIQHLGKMTNIFGDKLLKAKKEIKTYLGFYPDYYMSEVFDKDTEKMFKEIIHNRDAFFYNGIGRLLTAANITFDVYNVMDESNIPVEKVETLWMFSTRWMDQEIQIKLRDYVKDGGTLILFPDVPQYDLKGNECNILSDILGTSKYDIKKGWELVDFFDIDSIFVNQRVVLKDFSGEPIIFSSENKNECSGFVKKYGNGKIMFLGIGFEHDYNYKIDFIKALAKKINIEPVVELDDESLSVTIRSNNKDIFIFINNYDELDKKTRVKYKGDFLFGGNEIYISKRSGVMLISNCNIFDDINIYYSTVEIYDLIIEESKFQLYVKLQANGEGEIVLYSKLWSPIKSENIEVFNLKENVYKVRINDKGENNVSVCFSADIKEEENFCEDKSEWKVEV